VICQSAEAGNDGTLSGRVMTLQPCRGEHVFGARNELMKTAFIALRPA